MRRVILYGELGKLFGKEHLLSVRSAGEAVQALCVNYPALKRYLTTSHTRGVGFKVFVGNSSLKKLEDVSLPSSQREDIRIAPAILGSGAVVRIFVGAALIGAGLAINYFSAGTLSPIGSFMIQVGAVLVLGGVFELLFSPPKKNYGNDNLDENGQSFIFSGPENVTRQGGAVPVGYGRVMIGSTVVSAGIEGEDQ
jgi:predicted phage tail protein